MSPSTAKRGRRLSYKQVAGGLSRSGKLRDSLQGNIREIIEELLQRRETLALAESCTGGFLAAQFVNYPGVSEIFWGGVVCYSNESKNLLLNVSKKIIKLNGAVSEPVAKALAKGLRKQFKVQWAVSITGVAGPSGGTINKPVGTTWISIQGPQIVWTEKFLFNKKGLNPNRSREWIRYSAALKATELLIQALRGELK